MDSMKEVRTVLDKLKQERDEYYKRNVELEKLLALDEGDLALENVRLKQRIDELLQQNTMTQELSNPSRIRQLEQALRESTETISVMEEAFNERDNEIEKLRAEIQSNLTRYENEKSKLKSEAEFSKSQLHAIEELYQVNNNSTSSAFSFIDSASSREDTQSTTAELKKMKQDYDEAKKENMNLQSEIQRLREELHNLTVKCELSSQSLKITATALEETEQKLQISGDGLEQIRQLGAEKAKALEEAEQRIQSLLNSQVSTDELEEARQFGVEKAKALEEAEQRLLNTQALMDELEEARQFGAEKAKALETERRKLEHEYQNENDESIRKLQEELASTQIKYYAALNDLEMNRKGLSKGWKEETEVDDYPAPRLTIRSPEIQSILEEWTTDQGNISYITNWCSQILGGVNVSPESGFRTGVELTKLTGPALQGFLKIIVPLLKTRSDIDVTCESKEIPSRVHYELRIKVEPKAS